MKRIFLLIATMSIITLTGCEKSGTPNGNEGDNGNTEQPDEGEKEEEWTGEYPKGVTVSDFKDDLGNGSFCSGFVAVLDFNANPNLKFNVVSSKGKKKTLSEQYKGLTSRNGKPCLAINGGYFGGNTSVSLAIMNKWVEWVMQREVTWPSYENPKHTVYPVRSAFGLMEDGTFEVQWTYCTDISSKEHCAFPSALDNDEKTQTFMQTPPTADYPGAFAWEPTDAIGGGPRLVQNRKNVAVENYWKEVFDAGGTAGLSRQPRTAIGVTEDNKVIMIVCDGRKMNGSSGFTLAELADKLISLGAKDAINLDGGGSSEMVGKDAAILNRPSDSGSGNTVIERPIVTAVVISELQK